MSLCLHYTAHLPTTRTLTLEQRRAARIAAGVRRFWSVPVRVVPGDSAPELTGSSWCYRTRGGSRIYHPSAYSRRGWSNMVYSPSTRSVVVGAEWFARG